MSLLYDPGSQERLTEEQAAYESELARITELNAQRKAQAQAEYQQLVDEITARNQQKVRVYVCVCVCACVCVSDRSYESVLAFRERLNVWKPCSGRIPTRFVRLCVRVCRLTGVAVRTRLHTERG